jgi:predicted O-methyltransferase YrrM
MTERKFEHDWFSHWQPIWDKMLFVIDKQKDLNFLEIGCFEGRCTTYLLDNWLRDDNSNIVCIDTFDGGLDQKDGNINLTKLYDRFKNNISGYEHKVEVRKGFSYDQLLELNSEKRKFDLIYIDASHLTKDVLEDAVLSFKLCNTGGLIIFDDYLWPSPQDIKKLDPGYTPYNGINSFLLCYQDKIEILYKGYQVFVRKISD